MLHHSPGIIAKASCFGFLFGITLCSWSLNVEQGIDSMAWIAALCVLLLGCVLWVYRPGFWLLIFGCISFLLAMFVYIQTFPDENSITRYIGQEIVFEGGVKDVDEHGHWQTVVLSEVNIGDHIIHDRVQVTTLAYPEFFYNNQIRVRCTLEQPEAFEGFAYDRYLASKSIYARCFSYDVFFIDRGEFTVISFVLQARSLFIETLDKVFGEPHGSLLVGLLLGEQRFSQEWEERFLQTGTTHIVAASGYNISIVLWIAMGFFAWLGIRRQRAFAFLVTSVAAYILLAGADAAVFRAGVMGIVLLLSHQTGRKTSMVNILLLTASIMLFINPRLLRDDVGFQLSMMSTIGLIYLCPKIDIALRWIPNFMAMRESVSATVAATFMSLPILLLQFRSFAFISLLANVFVLPWIPLAMTSGAIAVCFGFFSVKFAAFFSAPAWLALTIMLWVVEAFANIPIFVQSVHWIVVSIALIVWTIFNYQLWFLKNRF